MDDISRNGVPAAGDTSTHTRLRQSGVGQPEEYQLNLVALRPPG